MHSLNHHTTHRSDSPLARDPALTDDERLSGLVDDIITLNAEGAASWGRLRELGWTMQFLADNIEEATSLANKRFMRGVDEDPAPPLDTRLTEMAGVIASLMPPAQVLIAELQSRGFTKRHIDLLFHKARAKASLAFCHGKAGEMH